MTPYLFLKFAFTRHSNASHRRVVNDGIDIKLLQLLSARYV